MKRAFLIAAIILSSVTLYAQQAHLQFKGIPIDGGYKAFAQKLVQKGFKQVESTDDGILLEGTFMAIPGVTVIVMPDPTSKTVSVVSAMIEAGENWASIEKKYMDIVSTYTEKYGEPTTHVEEFSVDVHDMDSWRMIGLEEGQCNYMSIWVLEGGHITVSVLYFQDQSYISCTYADDQNYQALRQSIMDDI